MKVVGIDLTGTEKRASGFCVLETKTMEVQTSLLYTDEEIVKKIQEIKPKVVAIDAPLTLPKGRKSIEERSNSHLRNCDKELLKRGIKFFPITLGPMRKLTKRGMKLKEILEKKGFKVIEVYPGGAQDLLGIPRKQKGLEKLKSGLKKLGIKGLSRKMNDDELDAVTCAYIAKLFLDGDYEVYGKEDGTIIMPKV